MQTKINFGYPKWPPVAILKKKLKLHFDLKWRKMQTKINFEHPKWHRRPFKKKLKWSFDLKWREMQMKMNFGHPKWPPASILKNIKVEFYLKWREMQSKINFGHPKWPPKWKLCFDLKWRENRWASGSLILLLFVEHISDQYPENKSIEVYKCFSCEIMRKSRCKSSYM
jgi:hypothetical protein